MSTWNYDGNDCDECEAQGEIERLRAVNEKLQDALKAIRDDDEIFCEYDCGDAAAEKLSQVARKVLEEITK